MEKLSAKLSKWGRHGTSDKRGPRRPPHLPPLPSTSENCI